MSNVSEPATVNNTIADGPELFAVNTIIQSTYAHYIVFGCAIFACCWAVWCAFLVSLHFIPLYSTSFSHRQKSLNF
jgi:hypothetical protein